MPPKPMAVGKKSAMKRIRSGELACRADGLEVGRGVCRSMAPLWWATETPTPRKEKRCDQSVHWDGAGSRNTP